MNKSYGRVCTVTNTGNDVSIDTNVDNLHCHKYTEVGTKNSSPFIYRGGLNKQQSFNIQRWAP